MSKTTMTVSFAAMLVASMPIAFAQTTTTTTTVQSTAPLAHPTERMLPGQVRFSDMNGATVYDTQDKNIGDVKDIVLDGDGRIGPVVLDVGAFLGIGGKLVAVGLSDINMSTDANGKPHFAVDMTKDQLKSAQAYELKPRNEATGTSTSPAHSTRD